jgi:hypothetical protein
MKKSAKNRISLKSVRLKTEEIQLIENYLKKNPVIENFSTLMRMALLKFLQSSNSISLHAEKSKTDSRKPSFVWDYDLDKVKLKSILNSKNKTEKLALIKYVRYWAGWI